MTTQNTITITLTDTPTGGVSVRSDFRPAVGHPLSPAQMAALDIINRTAREWGTPIAAPATQGAAA